MLTTRRRTALGCLFVAAALSLTGCGGGSTDSGDDRIAGADGNETGSAAPSGSASASAEKNAPAFDLPSDIKVAVDREATGEAAKDAILRDMAYAAQARIEAFAKGKGQTANMNRYFAANALTYWVDRVATVKKDGLTVTGDYRYFDFQVTDAAADKAAVRYCEDQSKAYNKVVKTGKVQRTQPSDKDFVLYTLQVAKDSRGDWQVTQQSWNKGETSCVQG